MVLAIAISPLHINTKTSKCEFSQTIHHAVKIISKMDLYITSNLALQTMVMVGKDFMLGHCWC